MAAAPPSLHPPEIDRRMTALDSAVSGQYGQTQAGLVRIGGPAVTAIHRGRKRGSLEWTSRAVSALGQIGAGRDLAGATGVAREGLVGPFHCGAREV